MCLFTFSITLTFLFDSFSTQKKKIFIWDSRDKPENELKKQSKYIVPNFSWSEEVYGVRSIGFDLLCVSFILESID